MNNKTARVLRRIAAYQKVSKKEVYRHYLALSHKQKGFYKSQFFLEVEE